MKKTVKIRKALPGETPGYYNKTAKFLKKAQMGTEVSSPSRDPQRMNMIYQNVYSSLKQSMTPDLVYNELVTSYALDEQTSLYIIKAALDQLTEEGFIDPEMMEKAQPKEEESTGEQDEQQAYDEQQRAAEDAEYEELAMSDEGYYNDEEALNNDRSHLEDEESQAFRYGGYKQEGGENDDYSEYFDYQDVPNELQSLEERIMNQYSNKGENRMEKPFSLEDLIAITPGIQGQEAFPDLSYYVGSYRPISDDYDTMNYLPTAKNGGQLPNFQKAGAVDLFKKIVTPLEKGLDFTRRVSPMTNLSGIRKSVPIFTGIGEAVSKISPKRFSPKLETTFTQNRNELWNVLNGAKPKTGVFSQTGTVSGGSDGSLQADRLLLYQDDVKNIIQNIEEGYGSFLLNDINPTAKYDGLVSGIYPMNSKVVSGVDDNGHKFFELKHTFTPNERLPFGTTPAKAKETTVKNRFYYKNDPTTGAVEVFDPLGNPLTTGVKTKYDITRPYGTSASKLFNYFTRDAGLGNTRMMDTPYPDYMRGVQDVESFYPGQVLGTGLGRIKEVSDIRPATVDKLGIPGKFGRGLENVVSGTWLPQVFGLGNPFRTHPSNVKEMSLPVYGYSNKTLGPDVINPAEEGSYGSDIKNAINYKYKLGLKSTLIGGGLGYLGYNIYDALANPCQCEDSNRPNFMAKDQFGKCPCNELGTDVGNDRRMNPFVTPMEERYPLESDPDSMYLLRQKYDDSIKFNDKNYWRYRDSFNIDESKKMLPDDYAKGGVTKKQFIKKFTAQFQEGGDQQNPTLGKGKRTDTLTNDIENKKNIFKSKLKNNSNVAVTEEIYKNAQGNPEILNLLMQNGPKENLAEDTQYGGYTENPFSMAEQGGFVDMDVENPLVKFIYGGDETEYYEPYDLPMAQNGMSKAPPNQYEIDQLYKAGKIDIFEANKMIDEYQAYIKANPNYEKESNPYYVPPVVNDNTTTSASTIATGTPEADVNTETDAGTTLNNTTTTNTKSSNGCSPGTVWSETYQSCIPVARINYNPRMVRTNPGFFNALLPWNPIFSNAGYWGKQMSLPFIAGTNTPYMGSMEGLNPLARKVTKTGIFGRPKKWIDYYGTPGISETQFFKDILDSENEAKRRRGSGNRYNVDDNTWDALSGKARRAIKRGYREDQRNEKRLEKQDEYQDGGQPCPPGYFKDPATGICKNFSGQIAPYKSTIAKDFQNTTNSLMTNPFQATGTNPLTGEDYMYSKDGQLQKNNLDPTFGSNPSKLIGINYKGQTAKNVDPEAGINVFNAGVNALSGFLDRRSQRDSQRRLSEELTSDNLYARTGARDRGDWVDYGSQLGQFQFDKMGQDMSGFSSFAKHGGYMQEGGYLEQDEEVYMTPEELEQFLAAGGQVEYL